MSVPPAVRVGPYRRSRASYTHSEAAGVQVPRRARGRNGPQLFGGNCPEPQSRRFCLIRTDNRLRATQHVSRGFGGVAARAEISLKAICENDRFSQNSRFLHAGAHLDQTKH